MTDTVTSPLEPRMRVADSYAHRAHVVRHCRPPEHIGALAQRRCYLLWAVAYLENDCMFKVPHYSRIEWQMY